MPPRRADRPRQVQRAARPSNTHNGGIWAAGWIAAEDRGLLLEQARYNARVAAIDAPGLSALGLIRACRTSSQSAQTEAVVAKQPRRSRSAGPEGRRCCATSTPSSPGSTTTWPPTAPNGAVDAQRRLRRQRAQGPVRRPGRRRRGAPLAVPGRPPAALGQTKGKSVFNDLRQFKNPSSPTSVDGKFNYGQIPAARPRAASSSTRAASSRRRLRPQDLPAEAPQPRPPRPATP